MMVTDLRCWWQNHYAGDLFRYVGDFLNTFNRSPTSQTCHQHIWSSTCVTNIDVADDRLEMLVIIYNQNVTHIDSDRAKLGMNDYATNNFKLSLSKT